MLQIYDDLWQTKFEIPFGNVHTHAYLLQCDEGNVLIYNTGHISEIDKIEELGGIDFQYLSHRDETGTSLRIIKERFGSKLCCHANEEPSISKSCPVDIVFSERTVHFSGIEVIPTPGHTDGSLSFLYKSSTGRTYLFTGDTLFQWEGRWGTLVLSDSGGSKDALVTSLIQYQGLDPDVVIWSASGSDVGVLEVTKDEWIDGIDAVIRELG